ncbi:hypothetical protein KSB_48810 [Ktedonobacter robiniae]|uniref:Uncharacterized protein n=1 Tax=Ktedonobacter robiniae TaxID=2778365 RepID=A0ABQ3UUB3_9CHLR|nr:hypothetical protein KSB_48810 [Ktedonobacter robiniae]
MREKWDLFDARHTKPVDQKLLPIETAPVLWKPKHLLHLLKQCNRNHMESMLCLHLLLMLPFSGWRSVVNRFRSRRG